MTEEIWRDIENYEGLYQVSNLGNVRSLDRFILVNNIPTFKRGRILSFRQDQKGYCRCALSKNGKCKDFKISRIVYTTFVGEIPDGMEIDHINTIRSDNRLCNLKLVTHKENCHNPITLKKIRKHIASIREIGTKASRKPIIQYDPEDMYPIAKWKSIKECENFTGISSATICGCLSGKTKIASGFIFQYIKSDS